MKKKLITLVITVCGFTPAFAQQPTSPTTENNMDRIEICKKNYTSLFGGEALTGEGTDPEMMDILQKYIFGEVFRTGDIDNKTRELITCVSLATMQQLPQLKGHVGATLNVGATPVEIREAIYQCAPLIGFPKTLNALGAMNETFTERGIQLPLENQATTTEENRHEKGQTIRQHLYSEKQINTLQDLPGGLGEEVERYLTEVLFGDFYTRSGLDLQTRELLTFCILTVIGAEDLLRTSVPANIKTGNSPEKLTAAVIQTMPYTGFPAALKALKVIQDTPVNPTADNKVRLSRIVVDPAQLAEYNNYLEEEIEASMRLEPGVLTLYAVAEKENPNRITILEIYASEEAYQSHVQTPHFLKYKEGTLDMVQELELIDTNPLIPGLKIK